MRSLGPLYCGVHGELERIVRYRSLAWVLAVVSLAGAVALVRMGGEEAGRPPAAPATKVDSRASGPATWELTWSDEFSGAAGSLPQAGKWSFYEGGVGNNELQRYVKLNDPGDAARNHASLDGNGRLVITARKNTDTSLKCPSSESPNVCAATSARLTSNGKFAQQGGRFEARIKVPAGRGLWPAFWAKGATTNLNEFDVMEQIGNRDGEAAKAHSALHGTDGYHTLGTYALASGTMADDFHTFAAEWYPDHISFSIDGIVYFTQYRAAVEQSGKKWPLVEDFYLILNLAVGGDWPGPPDAATPFPSQMVVDYVRVYRATTPRVNAVGAVTNFDGNCMDVQYSGTADGTVVQRYACNATNAQTWTAATDGTLQAMGKCLAVGGTANGSKTSLQTCASGNAAQQWRIEGANQSATVRMPQLLNVGSGRCLQPPASGAQLEVQDCSNALAQGWNVPTGPDGRWRLQETGGSIAKDASRNANDADCATGVTWVDDPARGKVAQLDGAGPGCATRRGQVVDTSKSFTVSTWVKLNAAPGTRNLTAVSQDGTLASGFYLQYNASYGSWTFNRMSGDVLDPANNTATWATAPATTAWTHLAGVYDAPTKTMTLYVNGAKVGTPAPVANAWAATGPLAIGRGKWNGNYGDRFPGRISDVQAFGRALNAEEVKAVYLYQ